MDDTGPKRKNEATTEEAIKMPASQIALSLPTAARASALLDTLGMRASVLFSKTTLRIAEPAAARTIQIVHSRRVQRSGSPLAARAMPASPESATPPAI